VGAHLHSRFGVAAALLADELSTEFGVAATKDGPRGALCSLRSWWVTWRPSSVVSG